MNNEQINPTKRLDMNEEKELTHNSVGKLVELLSAYPKDMEVVNSDGRNFIHIVNASGERVILSTEKPNGYCNTCGEYVYPEQKVPGYFAYCPSCDENKYEFETTKIK